jgi:hypothetical protein
VFPSVARCSMPQSFGACAYPSHLHAGLELAKTGITKLSMTPALWAQPEVHPPLQPICVFAASAHGEIAAAVATGRSAVADSFAADGRS